DQGAERSAKSAPSQQHRVDTRGDLAQLIDPAPGVLQRDAKPLPRAPRFSSPFLLGELQADDGADKPLLSAIVQIPAEALTRRVERGHQARTRRPQLPLSALAVGEVAGVPSARHRSVPAG